MLWPWVCFCSSRWQESGKGDSITYPHSDIHINTKYNHHAYTNNSNPLSHLYSNSYPDHNPNQDTFPDTDKNTFPDTDKNTFSKLDPITDWDRYTYPDSDRITHWYIRTTSPNSNNWMILTCFCNYSCLDASNYKNIDKCKIMIEFCSTTENCGLMGSLWE